MAKLSYIVIKLLTTPINVLIFFSLLNINFGFSICRNTFRCYNSGVERYGQSIFGPCRCVCPSGFTGARCQYLEVFSKRSSSLEDLNNYLLAKLLAQKRHRKHHRFDVRREANSIHDNREIIIPEKLFHDTDSEPETQMWPFVVEPVQ